MPRGKQFCPYENDYFDSSEFKVLDGNLVHDVDPLHGATDGRLLRKEGEEKVFPVADLTFTSPEEESP